MTINSLYVSFVLAIFDAKKLANTSDSSQEGAVVDPQPQQPNGQKNNFGTSKNILPSATKISPSQQKLRRDVDPNLFNQSG